MLTSNDNSIAKQALQLYYSTADEDSNQRRII